MARDDVLSLVVETESAHGVHATVTRTEREVFCQVNSVTRSEYYTALNAGIQPEYVFTIAMAEEYQGERKIRYRGKLYDVVRTYMTDGDGIELTVRRSDEK